MIPYPSGGAAMTDDDLRAAIACCKDSTPDHHSIVYVHKGFLDTLVRAAELFQSRRADPVREEILEALKDARGYVDAVVANATGKAKRMNYLHCLCRIDAAIAKVSRTDGAASNPERSGT